MLLSNLSFMLVQFVSWASIAPPLTFSALLLSNFEPVLVTGLIGDSCYIATTCITFFRDSPTTILYKLTSHRSISSLLNLAAANTALVCNFFLN